MLVELQVKNLALISEARIELGSGLTVLSGETGAGKTALLSALKLLVGERGDAGIVQDGANEASAQALFSDQELAPKTEHIVVRRLTADGRSRCYLDDNLVTVKALSQTIGPLLDLYGQHEHQSLLKPSKQLQALDDFAGAPVVTAIKDYQQIFKSHQQAQELVTELEESANSSNVAREQAAFVLREIAKVDPQPDESQQLKSQLPILQNGEQLALASANALELLRADGQVLDKLAAAGFQLEQLQRIDPSLDKLAQQLNDLLLNTEDLALELRAYRDAVEFDAQALEATLERLGQLESLCKRFGPTMADVLEAKQRSELLAGDSADFDERLAAARKNLKTLTAERQQAAVKLAEQRANSAAEFTRQLTQAVQGLAMPDANFEFAVTELPQQNWTLQGSNSYELLYRPTSTSNPRPLARIASGGELSRVMLALKTMTHSNEQAMTLVFDEIDAGIGGATATAVAKRLKQLAGTHQVLVVTHLAQIAAVADDQLVVSKENSGSGSSTVITRVSGQQRVEEVARMLSGSTDKTALKHARELLESKELATLGDSLQKDCSQITKLTGEQKSGEQK